MGRLSVTGSINDVNDEFYDELVELGEGSDLDTVVSELKKCLTALEKVDNAHRSAERLSVDWEGQAKEVYDELVIFQKRFIDDMKIAIESYLEAIAVIRDKRGDIANAQQIKEVQNL